MYNCIQQLNLSPRTYLVHYYVPDSIQFFRKINISYLRIYFYTYLDIKKIQVIFVSFRILLITFNLKIRFLNEKTKKKTVEISSNYCNNNYNYTNVFSQSVPSRKSIFSTLIQSFVVKTTVLFFLILFAAIFSVALTTIGCYIDLRSHRPCGEQTPTVPSSRVTFNQSVCVQIRSKL